MKSKKTVKKRAKILEGLGFKSSAGFPLPNRRRVSEIAEERQIPHAELCSLVRTHLPDASITGQGTDLWLNPEGQALLEQYFEDKRAACGTAEGGGMERRLEDLAADLGCKPQLLEDLAWKHLEEGMLREEITETETESESGGESRVRTLWVNPQGQALLEERVPLIKRFRGSVLRSAPNPNCVYTFVRDLGECGMKVPVHIPRRLRGRLTGKLIYIDAKTDSNGETIYHWAPPPRL